MKTAVTALVCLLAVVAAEPEPHVYHPYHHPYHHHHLHHHVKPLTGEGVAYHPGGGTSFVAPQVHGLTKRSADPDPNADPETAADPHNSYSYQEVHHGHSHHYPLHYGYRRGHYNGYPYHSYAHHVHHKRSADPEPEPHYSRPYNYGHYYHGHPSYYRYPTTYYRGYYHG